MASFQTIVLIIAVVILILCLTGVGVAIYFNRYSAVFPPISATCPDNYTSSTSDSSGSSGNIVCTANDTTSPNSKCNSISVNTSTYTGQGGLCEKYKWAVSCGVNWQGVTEASDPCPLS